MAGRNQRPPVPRPPLPQDTMKFSLSTSSTDSKTQEDVSQWSVSEDFPIAPRTQKGERAPLAAQPGPLRCSCAAAPRPCRNGPPFCAVALLPPPTSLPQAPCRCHR